MAFTTADDPSAFGTNRVTAMPMPAKHAAPSTISSTISYQCDGSGTPNATSPRNSTTRPSSASTTAVEVTSAPR